MLTTIFHYRNKDACKANSDDIEKLKQLIKELEAKSVETEEICSELKAESETNGMNIALANNNISDTKEDFKSWLERHDKEIEELKNKAPVAAPVEMPEIKAGDGLELQQLMSIFASKNPPDNTIKRIYDLETAMKEINGKVFGLDGVTERLKDLEARVGKLETRADKSDKKLDTHDIDIEDLKRRLTAVESMEMPAMPEVKEVANLDTAGIMKQIQFIRNEFNTFKVTVDGKAPKIDIDKLRDELKEYTDQEVRNSEKSLKDKIDDTEKSLSHKHD